MHFRCKPSVLQRSTVLAFLFIVDASLRELQSRSEKKHKEGHNIYQTYEVITWKMFLSLLYSCTLKWGNLCLNPGELIGSEQQRLFKIIFFTFPHLSSKGLADYQIQCNRQVKLFLTVPQNRKQTSILEFVSIATLLEEVSKLKL